MVDETLLCQLNKFTRRELSEDEVYIFDVILCDNDIDRQNEAFSDDEELCNLFESYLSSRREKGEVLSDTQVRYLMDKIIQITDVRAERIEIIKEAIRAGWKNFYPLKREKQQDKKPAVKKNRFNNFNQRQNNVSNIESALRKKQNKRFGEDGTQGLKDRILGEM